MKKTFLVGIILLIFCGFLITSWVNNPSWADDSDIKKIMNIPYRGIEFPEDVLILRDTAYYQLWGYINVLEAKKLWSLFKICHYKNIQKVYIYLNSGGGSAFDGLALTDIILNARQEGINITMEASGLVASAAVPVFLTANKRISGNGTIFMIHGAKLFKFLESEGMEDLVAQQEMLKIEANRYNQLLSVHSKLSVNEIAKMCAKTTWFTATQAKTWGMVDEIK